MNYRESYGIFASNGILFNHESPRRGETFVTRKITRAAARIILGLQDMLYLGNLDAKRDWGHAKDYVKAMWLILQNEKPDDFVIATGRTSSIRDFVRMVFDCVGIKVAFIGKGVDEKGVIDDIDTAKLAEITDKITLKKGQEIISVDPRYFRPTEVDILLGNPEKAAKTLGWKAETSVEELAKEMMLADIEDAKKEALLIGNNYFVRENYGD